MYDKKGVLTINTPDGKVKTLPVSCRIGQLYAARSESPNFNAKTGASIYFTLSAKDVAAFRAVLNIDDTRIVLAVGDTYYEVTNVQDHGGAFFKCPALRCKQHGKGWT